VYEAKDLVGTWRLVDWRALRNGEANGFPMGEDAEGQIIYSAEGRMAAFLMRSDFGDRPKGTHPDPDSFIAYGGTFRTEGDKVIHDVLYASIPHWIGNPLVRTIVPKDGDVLLNTAPERSKSGAEYVHQLLWRRIAG